VARFSADQDANLNIEKNGRTALIYASRKIQAAIIELLLDMHVDMDALSDNSEFALHLACCFANVEAARLLLARRGNVDLATYISLLLGITCTITIKLK